MLRSFQFDEIMKYNRRCYSVGYCFKGFMPRTRCPLRYVRNRVI